MTEFLLECIRPANLPATVLLCLVLLYWLLMIFGIFGMDGFDFDADLDVDVDMDADLDAHIDGGIGADVLTFFHFGEIPVMVLGSFFVLFFWITSVVSNHYFNPEWSMLVTLYCLLPNLLISLLLTKIAVMPMTPMFRAMKETASPKVLGSRGVVSTSKLDGEFGQISIDQDGPPIVVNAITANNQTLVRNQEIKVVRFDEETGVYIVEPVKPENK